MIISLCLYLCAYIFVIISFDYKPLLNKKGNILRMLPFS